jgi:hypothetical protein
MTSDPPGDDDDDATLDWSAPDAAEFSEAELWEARFSDQATDPIGFAPLDYPPATDPFDDYDADDALPGWSTPAGKPRRRLHKPFLAAIAVLTLGGLITAILLAPRLAGGSGAENAAMAGPAGGGEVSGPVDGLSAATFDLVDGVASVQLRAAGLGGDLYRIAADGVTPRVDRDGPAVRLRLPGGHGGPSGVRILLNASVRWTVHLEAGAAQKEIDLSGAAVDEVDLGGGASRIDLTLPAPHGRLAVRMSGGVDQFQVRLAGATPMRVTVASGAGEVTLAGSTHRGIAPGQSFEAYGWGGDAGVDLLAAAGMSALTVTVA